MVVSILGMLTVLATILLLEETHPQVASAPGGWPGNLIRILTCRRRSPDGDEGEMLVTESAVAARTGK